jgi:hypothetical protein
MYIVFPFPLCCCLPFVLFCQFLGGLPMCVIILLGSLLPKHVTHATAWCIYLSWSGPIQSTPPYFLQEVLMLLTNLRLGLPISRFSFGFPTNNMYALLFALIHATCPAHLIFLDLLLYICILSHIIISLSLFWFRPCAACQCLKHLIVFQHLSLHKIFKPLHVSAWIGHPQVLKNCLIRNSLTCSS